MTLRQESDRLTKKRKCKPGMRYCRAVFPLSNETDFIVSKQTLQVGFGRVPRGKELQIFLDGQGL